MPQKHILLGEGTKTEPFNYMYHKGVRHWNVKIVVHRVFSTIACQHPYQAKVNSSDVINVAVAGSYSIN